MPDYSKGIDPERDVTVAQLNHPSPFVVLGCVFTLLTSILFMGSGLYLLDQSQRDIDAGGFVIFVIGFLIFVGGFVLFFRDNDEV